MLANILDASAPDAKASLARAIPAITDTENVLLIREGRKLFDLTSWKNFLAKDCGLTLDKRQFNFQHLPTGQEISALFLKWLIPGQAHLKLLGTRRQRCVQPLLLHGFGTAN